ncbi:MAG: hypothetical protein GXO28_02975 [Methanopyri archaeon]|nr:hypothetical protein [Methanopyri archaeon]
MGSLPDLTVVGEEVGSTFEPEELIVTNHMVTMAIEEVVGERSSAVLMEAGRLIAEHLAEVHACKTAEDVLDAAADAFGFDYAIEDDVIRIGKCKECLGVFHGGRKCKITAGIIQGAYYVETGEVPPVCEIECGDECVFKVGEKGEWESVPVDEYLRHATEWLKGVNVDPEEAARFKVATEAAIRRVLGGSERPMFFRAGKVYVTALYEVLDAPEDPEELVERYSEISGADYRLEGDQLIIEPCLECAGHEGTEPMCHAARGAVAGLLELYGVPFKDVVETRCSAPEGEIVGTCTVKIKGTLWTAKRAVAVVKSMFG